MVIGRYRTCRTYRTDSVTITALSETHTFSQERVAWRPKELLKKNSIRSK